MSGSEIRARERVVGIPRACMATNVHIWIDEIRLGFGEGLIGLTFGSEEFSDGRAQDGKSICTS